MNTAKNMSHFRGVNFCLGTILGTVGQDKLGWEGKVRLVL